MKGRGSCEFWVTAVTIRCVVLRNEYYEVLLAQFARATAKFANNLNFPTELNGLYAFTDQCQPLAGPGGPEKVNNCPAEA